MLGDFLILRDSGYVVRNYKMTILSEPGTEAEQLYNASLIRRRNAVEILFGVFKRHFPILFLGRRFPLKLIQGTIVACAVLHNIGYDFNKKKK